MSTKTYVDEETKALRGILEALQNGDREAEAKLWPKIKISTHLLLVMKRIHGAEYIRNNGYNTENADRELGPGWLDDDNIK